MLINDYGRVRNSKTRHSRNATNKLAIYVRINFLGKFNEGKETLQNFAKILLWHIYLIC